MHCQPARAAHPVASYYERYWSDEGFFPKGMMSPGLEALYRSCIPPGATVLDVGCGDGQTSGAWLAANGRKYRGVDVSSNAVAEARRAGLDAIAIQDASLLPFQSATFDAVVCIEVLEHLFDPAAALAEMCRVLKPGAVFIATVPNTVHWRNRLDFFVLGRWNPLGDTLSVEEPWRDPHIRFFNMASMRRLVESSNLRLVSIRGQGGGFLKSIPWLRQFSGDRSSALYRLLEHALPGLFGYRIEVICRKDAADVSR